MARMIILRGNSGSGKTTVAKALQKRFGSNTMLISQDVIRRDMLQVKDGPDSEAVPLIGELLKNGRSHSEVVILEGIMCADWYRPVFELAVRLYEKVDACYFDLPFEETLRRHQLKPNCKEFGEVEMRRWWREKDFSDVLSEVRICAEKDLGSIVEDICGGDEKKNSMLQ